jgi:prepilin-type N-terminal cleavage/methylation domain-containing protein
MNRIASAGFTLIELLVVIGIIGLLAVALLPRIFEGQLAGEILADSRNLAWHYESLHTTYKLRNFTAPKEGGHKFVLSPWVYGACEHTQENRDRYFTPSLMQVDPYYGDLAKEDPRKIWRSFDDITSEDTHYAGRAQKYYRNMWSGHEALMANDNEMGPSFADGTINILMGGGSVRTWYKEKELKEFWDDNDPDFELQVGPDSPVDILQKLRK